MKLELEKLHEEIPFDLLLSADPSLDQINQYIVDSLKYVIKNSGLIIGIIVLKEIENNAIELMNISANETFQNQGVGTKLLEFAISTAKLQNKSEIKIRTANSSVKQIRLYQRMGFKIVGIEYGYFKYNYENRLFENGIECTDKVIMKIVLPITTSCSPISRHDRNTLKTR